MVIGPDVYWNIVYNIIHVATSVINLATLPMIVLVEFVA